MKIVAFGDSITYGDTGDHGEPHPRRWTTLLAEKTGHEVVNKGVNGDTTRLALERFPADVQESGADVVLIQFGYNDCNHWDTDRGLPRVSMEAYAANMWEMWKRAKRFNIKPLVVDMHWARRGLAYESWQAPYIKWLLQFQVRGHRWADAELELPDGLHLSTEDNERYADEIAEALEWRRL